MRLKVHTSGLCKEKKNAHLESKGQYDRGYCGNIFITKELTMHSLYHMSTRKLSQRE